MTGRNTPSPDSVLHLLREAGVDEDPALLEVVEGIAELAVRPAPKPSAELSRLMADGGKAPGARWTKGRISFIGGALAVSMGVGMSGVAAGPVDRHEELDSSIDSVIRFWARDNVDRIAPVAGAVAGQGVVVPSAPSDAFTVEAAPPPSASGGGVGSERGFAGDGSGSDAGPRPALPAAHPGAAPAPAPIIGVTVPSPSRQFAPSGIASVGTPAPKAAAANTAAPSAPAPNVAAPHVPAPYTVAARGPNPRPSDVRGGTGMIAGGAGESGGTAASGVAEVPASADDLPRHMEEPVRFATLGWVNEGPDESMSDEAVPLMLMRTLGAAPDNVVFLSEPMSDDGPWLALFIPDATELTWDPATEEYAPWVPAAGASDPDASSDAGPSTKPVQETSGDAVPGLETPSEALDGGPDDIAPSSGSLPQKLPQEPVDTAPAHDGSDAASEEETVKAFPRLTSPEDASSGTSPAESNATELEPTEFRPTESEPMESVPTRSTPVEPVPSESTPTPDSSGPVEEPSVVAPASSAQRMSPDEPLQGPSEEPTEGPSGVLPAPGPHEGGPAG